MGNQIVIPASKDWWSSILNSKNYYVRGQIQSGSLFLKFICTDKSKREQLLVKAYQSEHLSSIPYYKEIKKYFEILSKSDIPMIHYFDIIETSNSAFFIRRKFGQPLSEVISQEPSLYIEEKFWVTYQLCSAIHSLHKINIFHGDLKPSNILYVPSGRVYIVDPAPFKPYMLDQYHPHYYYYFFANDDSLGCYLAPERLLGTSSPLLLNSDNIMVNDLILADLFSLGCIIAYMYLNGEPLFSSDTARKYGKGEFNEELENTLSTINDKKIISLIKGLISLKPNERKKAFDNYFKSIFPSDFKSMNEKFFPKQDFFILNQKPNSELFDYNTVSMNAEAQKDFPAILSEYSLLKGTREKPVTVGTRMIFYSYFGYRVLKAKSLGEISYIIDFLVNFSRKFDDESRLMRVVPLFIKLLDFEVLSVVRSILFGLVQVFQSMKTISDDLKDVIKDSVLRLFSRKFNKEGLPLGNGYGTESEIDFISPNRSRPNIMSSSSFVKSLSIDSYVLIIAEFLPYFSYEIFRLQPENLKDCLLTFSLPKNNLDVFKIFANSMKKVAKNGSYFFYYNYSALLFEFFNNEVDFKIEYVKMVTEIYINVKDDQKTYLIDDLNIILPHIIRSICPNSSISFTEFNDIFNKKGNIKNAVIDNTSVLAVSKTRPDLPPGWDGKDSLKWEIYTCVVLQFFIAILENEILDNSFTFAISNLTVYLLNSKSEKVYYLLSILKNYFTPYAHQLPLLTFINEHLKTLEGKGQGISAVSDSIYLTERKRFSSSEKIKFANPFITVPLVQKYKTLNLSPRFILSKRSETEVVTNIALDKKLCVYSLGGSKIRYFSNPYSSENSSIEINELSYVKDVRNNADRDSLIKHIDILSQINNCIFTHHIVVAYEKGRIDCIDMNQGVSAFSSSDDSSPKSISTNAKPQNIDLLNKPPACTPTPYMKTRIHHFKNFWNQGGDSKSTKVTNAKNANFDSSYHCQTVQKCYESRSDLLTSFCTLKNRCCLVSGKWNGRIKLLDVRAPSSTNDDGCFGFIGGGSVRIPFKLDSLVSLSPSPVNDDFLYAGFASGIVTAIDLRVGLPVTETLTIPAHNVWPVAAPKNSKSSCFAVYDNESTIQFVSTPKSQVIQTIKGNSFVGTTFNGGVVLADDFSASYLDLLNGEDSCLSLYDRSMRKFSPSDTKVDGILSLPEFDKDELSFCDSDYSIDLSSSINSSSLSSGMSSTQDFNDDYCDKVEKQVRRSISSVHKHKNPVKCIAKYENLFATGDSAGFVNLWAICSPDEAKKIATYT